jgi:hypothetical protein
MAQKIGLFEAQNLGLVDHQDGPVAHRNAKEHSLLSTTDSFSGKNCSDAR